MQSAPAPPPYGGWRGRLHRRLPARPVARAGVGAFVLLVVTLGIAARVQSFPLAPVRVAGLVLACSALGLAGWAPRPAAGLAAAGLAVSAATAVVPAGTFVAAVWAFVLVARTDRRGGAAGLGTLVALLGLGALLPPTNQWDNLEIPLPGLPVTVWLYAVPGLLAVLVGLAVPRRPVPEAAPAWTFLGRSPAVTAPEALVVACGVGITALRYASLFTGPWLGLSTDRETLLGSTGAALALGLLCVSLAAAALSPWFPRTGFTVAAASHGLLVGFTLYGSLLSLPTLTATTTVSLFVLARVLTARPAGTAGTGAAFRRAAPVLVAATVVTAALATADETAGMVRDLNLQSRLLDDVGFGPAQALRAVLGQGLPVAVVLPVLAVAGAWLVTRSLADRDRLERAVSREAATAERSRIARELHDVVAHHVSLVTVRAESAPYVVPDLPDAARDAFGEIATTSRRALDELRDVLGVLGRPDGEEAERAPQPTLADVAGLVAAARHAGARVAFDRASFDRLVDVADVPAATGIAAHAVVREALSNARRHAPGQEVTVRLTTDDGTLRVTVSTPASTPPSTGSGADGRPGLGLVGLRERVDAVGGTFTAGPVDGRFVVVALLPLRRPSEASA
ncbi:MAG: hypothetical protein HY830_12210 [Actinobacteria bacterium]|nr:hypothetical protein [Actinomycetota bacterium]